MVVPAEVRIESTTSGLPADKIEEALIKPTDYSVPSAVADGYHSSDDISSTCVLMTLTRGHPLPRTVLNTHLIRGSLRLSSVPL